MCGGKGSLSIHQLKNDTFTDVLSLVSGSFGGVKNEVNVVLENGTECIENDIPYLSGEVENRGVTVIEDHTIVVCGGKLNTGFGKMLKTYLTQTFLDIIKFFNINKYLYRYRII